MRSVDKIPDASQLRAERREARAEDNRRQILDAAERVAGEQGLAAASIREIAAAAGFSSAALYLFFDNKEHLLAAAMTRRGAELVAVLEGAAHGPGTALARLHKIVDVTVEFFADRPDFRRLLRQISPAGPITGPVLSRYVTDPHAHFTKAMALIARVIRQGQRQQEIRAGQPAALGHLFSVMVNEHVFLAAEDSRGDRGSLTKAQFHALIDGAFRR